MIEVVILEWVKIFLGREHPSPIPVSRGHAIYWGQTLGWVTGNDIGAPLVKGQHDAFQPGFGRFVGEKKFTTCFTQDVVKNKSPTLTEVKNEFIAEWFFLGPWAQKCIVRVFNMHTAWQWKVIMSVIWRGTGASLWLVYPVKAGAQPFKNTEHHSSLF